MFTLAMSPKASAYFSSLGFSAGLLATLLLFVYLLGRRINFPGAGALGQWGTGFAGTLLAAALLNMSRLNPGTHFLLDLLTFTLLYFSNFQFRAGFLTLHQMPRQSGIVLPWLGFLLVYAVVLSWKNEFWVRLAGCSTMQVYVWSVSTMTAARVAFKPQQKLLSPWLSLTGVSLALGGALLRVYSSLDTVMEGGGPQVYGFSAMHDYGFTVIGIMIGSLGLVLGCFEKVLELTRRAETTDALTGLPNRRAIVATGIYEVEHARSHGRHLVLALIDIDGLKRINEIHGHDTGDQVLIELGRLIVPASRRSEFFGRYSDELFCLICPDAADALAEGERLQQRIRGFAFSKVGTLTASIGLASLPRPADAVDWPELVRRAGQALNQAKRQGGGCTVYSAPGENLAQA